jgi:hypothetical protein
MYSDSADIHYQQAGGKDSLLYYFGIRYFSVSHHWPNLLLRYNGTSLTTIWSDTTLAAAVADVAVDNNGNVYFFTGAIGSDSSSTLNIMSPNGTFLANIPITFDYLGAYGCFFDNNTLYVAFSSANPFYPNKMIPITISGITATIGTPIAVPATVIGTSSSGAIHLYSTDLASCSNAEIIFTTTTGIAENNFENDFAIYPNPVKDMLTVSLSNDNSAFMQIYDVMGREIISKKINTPTTSIDFSKGVKGIYFAKIIYNNNYYSKKIIKY